MEGQSPKVFISYSHIDINYEKEMLNFANKLRKDGIDANIDLYEDAPNEGWLKWMEKQVYNSDFVIIVCSQSYWKKFHESENNAKGIAWEVNLIYQILYDKHCNTNKFIPVFTKDKDEQYILIPLKTYTYYNISNETGYNDLWRRLMKIPKYEKPELGKIDIQKHKPLPEKEQKTMFISTPIDIDKWNNAGWYGMLYIHHNNTIVLGFLYQNYNAALDIFKEWIYASKNISTDDFLRITYVIPPFPNDCFVNSDSSSCYGNGYFVHIGPNEEAALNRANKNVFDSEQVILMSISRFVWMNERNGSQFRQEFQQQVERTHKFYIVPVSIKEGKTIPNDGSIKLSLDYFEIGYDFIIEMHSVSFKKGIEVDDTDLCKVVLMPPK